MHDAVAMDLNALVDDTIALPFLPPSFVRPYLARNLVPLRGREARKRRLLADLQGSGLFKRRTAALAFGSCPPMKPSTAPWPKSLRTTRTSLRSPSQHVVSPRTDA